MGDELNHGDRPGEIDPTATSLIRGRYDRIAPVYDALEWMMEWRARRWRRDLWARASPGRILELGIGTGKNLRYHPPGHDVTAVDISEKMLARARRRARRSGCPIHLGVGDVQRLPFADATFDVVAGSFVFCSVPDPILGLTEARRVLKPYGQLLLLEHVLSKKPMLRSLMRRLDPLPFHIWGAHIDRDTVDNVVAAGFCDLCSMDLSLDVVKLIVARA